MRRSKWFFVFAIIFLGIAISAPYTLAAPLGYATPLGWAGSGARINWFNEPGGPPSNLVSDISIEPNYTTRVDYYSGMMDGWSESSAYVLKGNIYSGETEDQQAGGYFRDELYFATYNGLPAELALTFSVHASGYVGFNYNDDPGYAWLNLGLNVPVDSIPTDWYYLSNNPLVNATDEGDFFLDSTVTLKSTDLDSSYLILSGTYLPISVSLWGTVNGASLNWGDTVELVGVQAFQNGVLLDNSQFTILSQNNEGYFSDFAHEMGPTNPVPEPATMLLLGSGLIGLVGLRKKFKK